MLPSGADVINLLDGLRDLKAPLASGLREITQSAGGPSRSESQPIRSGTFGSKPIAASADPICVCQYFGGNNLVDVRLGDDDFFHVAVRVAKLQLDHVGHPLQTLKLLSFCVKQFPYRPNHHRNDLTVLNDLAADITGTN